MTLFDSVWYNTIMNKQSCGQCASCTWRARWEAHYKEFLKNNPLEEEWIKSLRADDKKVIRCLKLDPVSPDETRSYKSKLINYWPEINI